MPNNVQSRPHIGLGLEGQQPTVPPLKDEQLIFEEECAYPTEKHLDFNEAIRQHDEQLFQRLEEWLQRLEATMNSSNFGHPRRSVHRADDQKEVHPVSLSVQQIEEKKAAPFQQTTPSTPQEDSSQISSTKPSRTSILPDEETEPKETCCQQLGKETKPFRWQEPLRRLVRSWWFEGFFALAILTNSVFIAVQVELDAVSPGQVPDMTLFLIASAYTFLFTFEFVLRILAFGPTVFCGEDWLWMLLDVCVVFSSLLEFALELVLQQDPSSHAFSNMRLLRVLRVAKVTRALRMVRVVKFVRSLKSLLFCIGRTIRALAWSLVLLLLIVFVFALIFTDLTSEHLRQPDLDDLTAGFLRLRFGSLEVSMHTLYASITGGFTWVEARDAFGQISFVWGILYEGYISFCLFAVLNVMTGAFCHSAIESAEKDHEMNLQLLSQERAKYFRAIKRLFTRLDTDSDGGITAAEFEVALLDPALINVFEALEITSEDAWSLFRTLDSDGDSSVGPQEFIDGCLRLKGPARSIDVVCMKRDLNILMQKLELQADDISHVKKKLMRG